MLDNDRVFPILNRVRLHVRKRQAVGVTLIRSNQFVVDVNRVAIMISVAYFIVSRLIAIGRAPLVIFYFGIRPNSLSTVMPMGIIILVMFMVMIHILDMFMMMLLIGRMVMAIPEMKMRLRVVRIRSIYRRICMRMGNWMPKQKQEDQQ